MWEALIPAAAGLVGSWLTPRPKVPQQTVPEVSLGLSALFQDALGRAKAVDLDALDAQALDAYGSGVDRDVASAIGNLNARRAAGGMDTSKFHSEAALAQAVAATKGAQAKAALRAELATSRPQRQLGLLGSAGEIGGMALGGARSRDAGAMDAYDRGTARADASRQAIYDAAAGFFGGGGRKLSPLAGLGLRSAGASLAKGMRYF